MTYFLAGFNTETLNWDILDRQVPSDEVETLRKQLQEATIYKTINIVSES